MLAQAKTQNAIDLGQNIIKGGLILQILFFGVFMVVAILFHLRISQNPTPKSLVIDAPWQRQMTVLYTASLLIMVRSVFRVIEYVQGSDGVLLQTEIYLYIFDAVLVFNAMVLFNIWHPGKVIANKNYQDFDTPSQYGQGFEMLR